MHKHYFLLLTPLLFLFACGNPIKNEEAQVEVEPGVDTTGPILATAPAAPPPEDHAEDLRDVLGYYVGDFRAEDDEASEKAVYADAYAWFRNNKINISLDAIRGDSVFGHSVVAGNDRPFVGTRVLKDGIFWYSVREPGDDQYDGAFQFAVEGATITGTWEAYNEIEIKRRKYTLKRRNFTYDPSISLIPSQRFIDWDTSKDTPFEYEEEGEVHEWIDQEFASATDAIYSVNASTDRLTKEQVENLKKGDLTIIRNAIYARHGYSFKQRPLRVFFDAQEWYVPVHADIRADFTELEKENIQLLLRYEENAAEYYDRFGRG